MTAKLLTSMSSLTETENRNNNIQTNKQKTKQNKKEIKTIKNTEKHTHKHKKKYSKSFTTMISLPETALSDFTSNLKGYLLHKCNVLLQKITCWTRVSRIFFRVSTLYRVGGGGGNCNKISKTLHCFKKEPRTNRKV